MTVQTTVTIVCDKTQAELTLKSEDGKKLTATKARAIAAANYHWTVFKTWDPQTEQVIELDLSPEGQQQALQGAGIEIKVESVDPVEADEPEDEDEEEIEVDEPELVSV